MIVKLSRVFLMFGSLLALWAVSRQAACEEAPLFQGRSLISWVNDLAQGRDPGVDKHNDAVKASHSRAKAALPVVAAATSDENGAIRSYARDALKAIQAEAAPVESRRDTRW